MSSRVTSLRPAAPGRGDLDALAIIKRGADRQFGDFVQIEAHRQHEVKKREGGKHDSPEQRELEQHAHRTMQPLGKPTLPKWRWADGTPGGHGMDWDWKWEDCQY